MEVARELEFSQFLDILFSDLYSILANAVGAAVDNTALFYQRFSLYLPHFFLDIFAFAGRSRIYSSAKHLGVEVRFSSARDVGFRLFGSGFFLSLVI
jgi:hypothetical protein